MADFDNNTPNNTTGTTDGFTETVTTGPIGNVDNSFQIPENAVILAKPDSGRMAVDVKANATYAISFNPNDAQLALENGDLVFNFNDGSQLILGDFAEVSPMPTIMLSDGTILAGDVVVAQLQDPSTDVFNLETAAGPDGGAGGQSSYDDDLGNVIDLIDNLPPLPFTTLAFRTFQQEDIDPQANPNLPGTFVPKFYTPFAAGVSGGFEDWQPNQHVSDLTEFPMQLVINYAPPAGDNDVVDAINVADIPAGTRVFIGTPGVPGSFTEIPVAGGEVDITSAELGGQSIFMLPAGNSDADFEVTVNLETRDPDTDEVTILSEPAVAIIDAVADKPEIDGTVELADGTIDGSAVSGTDGQNVSFNVDIDFFDNDGSETHTIVVTGVPEAWSLVSDDSLGATTTVEADGTVTHTVTVGAGFDGTLEFNPNAWNSDDFGGPAEVTFTATAEEVEFDEELLLTNNEAETSQTFQVTLADDVPEVILVSGPATLNEDDLTIPGPDTVDGTITVDFSSDAPGDVVLKTDGLADLGLTSGGEDLTYSVSPDGLVVTATDESGNDVFTITLNDTPVTNGTEETYTYEFELLQPLDHETGGATDALIDIPVCFTATDADGDEVNGLINLQVVDDVPVVEDTSETVDETTDLGTPVNGTIPVDFGADGGEIDGNNTFSSSVPLISGGEPVTVAYVDGVYTATTPGGDVVFTTTLNDDGTYTFVQDLPLDHPDTTDANDPIDLNFGYTATDSEGDTESGNLSVTILDDGPTTQDVDVPALDETDGLSQTASGTIPFDLGNDDGGSLNLVDSFVPTGSVPAAGLSSGGEPVTVALVGDTYTATTPDGTVVFTMTIDQETGDYDFQINEPLDHADGSNPDDIINLEFTYEVVDGDGDIVEGTITVPVRDDAPTTQDVDVAALDETDGLSQTASGTIPFDLGNDDGAGAEINLVDSFVPTGSVPAAGLSSGGEPVTVALVGDTYTATTPDGTVVFTMTVDQETGDYDFQINEPLDHADGSNPDDIINLEFTYEVVDADGDIAEGTITVPVRDDAPVAIDEPVAQIANDGPQAVDGNVLTNDTIGEDVDGSITQVEFDGTVVDFATDGQTDAEGTFVEIDGDYGTLKLYEDGDYTYTVTNPPAGADGTFDPEAFTYTIQDADGDTDTAEIPFSVENVPALEGVDVENEVDETFIDQTVTDTITIADATGFALTSAVVSPTGSMTDGTLTSNGIPVTTALVAGQIVGSAGGETIFTLDLADNGEYTFTLLGNLDHADGNDANDIIDLNFTYEATGIGGQSVEGNIEIHVLDDVPTTQDVNVPALDETDGLSQTASGTIPFDLGNDDGAGAEINLVDSFVPTGSVPAAGLSSGGEPVTVALVGDTYTATTPDGTVVFTMTVDQETGDYDFQINEPLDHADGSNPDDIINLEFSYEVIDADGDIATGTITVPVRDDAPVALDDDALIPEGSNTATGNVIDNDDVGEDVDGSITQVEFDGTVVDFATDGQTDAEGTFVEIDGDYGTLKLYEDGDYTYTSNGTAGGSTSTSTFNADPADVAGNPATITEDGITITSSTGTLTYVDLGDGAGIGIDGAGNDSAKVWPSGETLSVEPASPADSITFTVGDIGSNNAGDGIDVKVFFSDDPSDFEWVEFQLPTPHPTNGLATFTVDADDFPGHDSIASIDITSISGEGSLGISSFTLNSVTVETGGDVVKDDFEYTLTDADGDTDTAVLEVCIEEGTPIVPVNVENTVDETFATQTVSDSIVVDGAASFALTSPTVDADGSMTDGTLTSNGLPVTTALVAGQIIGSAGGEEIFTLDISDNGEYNFTLIGSLDHADGSDANDIINLDFAYEVTDANGGTAEGTISIHVRDDVPTAVDDGVVNVYNTGPQTVDGNVLLNDDFGQDGAGETTAVSFGGVTVTFADDAQSDAEGTFIEIDGQYGTLKLYEDGDYEYTVTDAPVGASGWVGENFEYTMQDSDTDTDTALVRFCVQRVPEFNPADVENVVDETFIDQTVSDDIIVEGATSFALGTIDGNLDYTSGGSQLGGTLTSNGVAVAVALVGGQIVGTAGGEQVFTLDLNNDGSYSFTLLGTLDHADGSDANDIINLDFTYTAENTFGQAVEGNISIDVLDDIPTPCPDRNVFEGVAADGNVLSGEGSIDPSVAGDGFGQDGPGSITQIEFEGNVVTFTDDAQTDFHGTFIEIDGENGTLKLYEDGDYQYVLNTEGSETCIDFDFNECLINNSTTLIESNGITVSVGAGQYLSFFDGGPSLGTGIGINSDGKVYGSERLDVSFENAASSVDLTVADIGANNAGDGIDLKIWSSDTEFVIVEQAMPIPNPSNGTVEFTVDASDYGFDGITKIEMFTSTDVGTLGKTSFVLNDVKAYYNTAEASSDEFVYTIEDFDGDAAATTLTFEATDPSADTLYTSSASNSGNLLIENDVADEIFYDESADTLDISDLLSGSGYQPGVSDIADYLQIDSSGDVHVDVAGTGSFGDANTVGTFEGGTAFDTINVVLNDDEGDIPVQIV